MAKRTATSPKKPVRTRSTKARSSAPSFGEAGKFGPRLKEFFANPAVRYVAGGIASAILAKVATKLADRYPEITRMIGENLDSVEARLTEFQNGLSENSETASRH